MAGENKCNYIVGFCFCCYIFQLGTYVFFGSQTVVLWVVACMTIAEYPDILIAKAYKIVVPVAGIFVAVVRISNVIVIGKFAFLAKALNSSLASAVMTPPPT